MKRAIVTGANGFVGSAVCQELCRQGVEVIAAVRSKESDVGNIAELPGIRLVYCKLEDIRQLKKVISVSEDIDTFFHFAWDGCSRETRGDSDIQTDNIRYTCDAVKACAEIGCNKFIFAGSIMEYEVKAVMQTDIIPESSAIYSTAKLAADYMARILAGEYGISYVCALISNIYGPGENSTRLINSSIRKLLRGEHCSFTSGEQLYDFIYITDAARIIVKLGEKGRGNRTYYIGNSPRPLREYLSEIRDIVSPGIEIGLGELPFNCVSLNYKEFDREAVYKDTGIIAEVCFELGIKKTSEWIKKREREEREGET